MPDDPPQWHKDNKGRARDRFEKQKTEKSDPEKKPEIKHEGTPANPFKPTEAETQKFRLHPPQAFRFEDTSGRPDPSAKLAKPRKHSKEQIEEWAQYRRNVLAKKHRAITVEMNAQHDLEKKKKFEKGADAATLKTMAERHKSDHARREKKISQDKADLEALVAKSREAGQILDPQYVAELERRAKHTKEQIDEWAQHRRDRLDATIHERWKELHDRHAGNPDLSAETIQAETTNLQRKDNDDMAALDSTIATAYETRQIPDREYLQERGMETPERDTGRDTGRTYDDGGGRDR